MKKGDFAEAVALVLVYAFVQTVEAMAPLPPALAYFVCMNHRVKMIGFHVLGWSLFVALVAAFVEGFGRPFSKFLAGPFLFFAGVYIALFYFNADVLLPRLYLRKRYAAYLMIALSLFAGIYFLKPFDRLVLHSNMLPSRPQPSFPPQPGQRLPPPANDARPPQKIDIVSVVLFIAVWSASSMQQIIRQWRTSERRAVQAEGDKVTAELQALKSQINPHFLFNTLNNIYSLAVSKSEHTADAVLKLSAILHYVTDDVRLDFVPLQSEVDCARAYIEMQKLRLSKKVTVEFTTEGRVEDKTVAPLLFMTFIENAFKYGTSNHESCTIYVSLRTDARNIHFVCRNRIFKREAENEREGLGLTNAKKRLAHLYPEQHLLNIDTHNDTFTVDLTVMAK